MNRSKTDKSKYAVESDTLQHTTNSLLDMALEQSNTKTRSKTGLRPPKKYTVFIHNDDFTTMEFVVLVLTTVFHKKEQDAISLMLRVHHSDKAAVGTYSYDVATTKVALATDMARSEGFPLRITITEA